jgi:glutamyl-tRNA synthetase
MVRTRMAPSPTGNLHIGTAYATMWPYLFAKHSGGKFILRIEDTDRDRSTKEFEENIINGLKWLGFEWDGEIPHQMDRLDTYKTYSLKLLEEGKAYYCFCTKEELEGEKKEQAKLKQPQVYSGKCRNLSKEEVDKNLAKGMVHVIRFRMPDNRGEVVFEDLIHGKISTNSALLGDMIIVRGSGVPLYNFAVVVDDIDMEITHILRGEDHISNTPKQILFFEAFDKTPPQFAHYQVILNQDRSGKLSKRTGSTSIDEFKNDGYLPEAMFNYIVLLGATLEEDSEIFSKEEVIKLFDIKKMHLSAAAWNQEKLDWINGEYIRGMSDEGLFNRLSDFYEGVIDDKEKIKVLVPLVKERIKTLRDFELLTDFIFEGVEYDLAVFGKINIDNLKDVLGKVLVSLEKIEKPWTQERFEQTFRDLAAELAVPAREMFQLIRVAISGKLVTPPLLETMNILGEEESINRIKKAIEFVP